jgi:protoporphyrinogen oxidase
VDAYKQTLLNEGVSIKLNSVVTKVSTNVSGKPCITLTDGAIHHFDEVIVTLPSSVSADICTDISTQEKEKLNAVEYLSVICLAVLMEKPISNFYVTNVTDPSVPFTGMIEMSALVNKKYLNGHSLLYLPKYVVDGDPLFDKTDEEIKQYFLDSFDSIYPGVVKYNVKFAGIAKAKHVITVAKLGYSDMLPAVSTSMRGVHIVNTAHIIDGTLNVNETITVAETKLAEILNTLQ